MRYELEHGHSERRITEASYKRGLPPPEFVLNAPELLPGLGLYLEAFRELSTTRPRIGMNGTPGAIAWDKIIEWGREFGFDSEEREYLVKLMRDLDDEYLEWMGNQKSGQPGAVQPTDGKSGK